MSPDRRTVAALVLLTGFGLAGRLAAEPDRSPRTVAPQAAAATQADSVKFNADWEATSGLLPDLACPPWVRAVTDSAPALTGGTLRISTTLCAQNVSYTQRDTVLNMPDTVVVEVRLRLASGSECIGSCGHSRQAASIAITTSGSTGTLFFVGNNEIFLTNGECSGITSLTVPTTDVPHTYRIMVYGGAVVRVYRDGALALTGHTYTSVSDNGMSPRIYWGEGSSFAYGTVYWTYVKHNAHKSGCGTTGVVATTEPDRDPLALRAAPNPSRGPARIEWSLTRRSNVRIALFDLAGRQVRRLADGDYPPGRQAVDWDGRDAQGRMLPSGAYLCRVDAGAGHAWTWLLRTR